MSSNQPDFDPLNPTREEADAMMAGYMAGVRGYIEPPDAAFAFAHGYRVGRNDRAGIADDDQRELARRAAEIRRNAEVRRRRLRDATRGPSKEFGV